MSDPVHHTAGYHVFFAVAYCAGTAVLAAKHEPVWIVGVFAFFMTFHALKAQQLWTEQAKRVR